MLNKEDVIAAGKILDQNDYKNAMVYLSESQLIEAIKTAHNEVLKLANIRDQSQLGTYDACFNDVKKLIKMKEDK